MFKKRMKYQNFGIIDGFANKKGFLGWYIGKLMSKEKVEGQLTTLYEKEKKQKGINFSIGVHFFLLNG